MWYSANYCCNGSISTLLKIQLKVYTDYSQQMKRKFYKKHCNVLKNNVKYKNIENE